MARPVLKTTPAQKASIGGLIVVALLILGVAILILGGEQGFLSNRYQLMARFERISGLQSGAPVWLAGQRVGYVSQIEFVRGVEERVFIDVTMQINSQFKDLIRDDSEARIGTLGLLGDKFVGISLGSPGATELSDGDYVQTDNPIDFEELIQKGVETFDDLAEGGKSLKSIAAKIDDGEGTIGKLINDPSLYMDIARLTKLTEKIVGKIDRNEGTVGRLFNDDELYDEMIATVGDVRELVDSLSDGMGTIGKLMKDPAMYDHVTASLGRIDTLIARIERGEGTSGKFISSDDLYQQLSGATNSLDSLLIDIRENPGRYFKVRVTLF
ncbi:MAG TPA: MCE family protein [candidate division Zixibacteria bacterium]|nr:MCE family protein [candidate division Zixibacteria bacterium]